MKSTYIVCSIAFLWGSCSTSSKDISPLDTSAEIEKTTVVTDTALIHFGSIGVKMIGLSGETFEYFEASHFECNSDTFFYDLPLGSEVDKGYFQVLDIDYLKGLDVNSKKMEFKVSESYDLVLSLQDEGPHLDLFDWNPKSSPYVPCSKESNGSFRTAVIDHTKLQYGFVDYLALRKHIKSITNESENHWVTLLDRIDSELIKKGEVGYPLSLGVGIRTLKLEGKIQNVPFVKWLVFKQPLGC